MSKENPIAKPHETGRKKPQDQGKREIWENSAFWDIAFQVRFLKIAEPTKNATKKDPKAKIFQKCKKIILIKKEGSLECELEGTLKDSKNSQEYKTEFNDALLGKEKLI